MGGRAGKGDPGPGVDAIGQAEIEGRGAAPEGEGGEADAPTAGPHEAPALTNPDATPGTGSLPSISNGDEADAATG